MDDLIIAAKILRPHGLHGSVCAEIYLENPIDIMDYDCYLDENGEQKLKILNCVDGRPCIISLAEIDSIDQAQMLSQRYIYINSQDLPKLADGEFYESQIVGFIAKCENGYEIGTVVSVHNFGAGDIIELDDGNFLPFYDEFLVEVNVDEKVIVYNTNILDDSENDK